MTMRPETPNHALDTSTDKRRVASRHREPGPDVSGLQSLRPVRRVAELGSLGIPTIIPI